MIKRTDDENGPAIFPLRDGYQVTIGDSNGNTFISVETEDGKQNIGTIVIEKAVLKIIPSGRRLGDSYTFVRAFGRK